MDDSELKTNLITEHTIIDSEDDEATNPFISDSDSSLIIERLPEITTGVEPDAIPVVNPDVQPVVNPDVQPVVNPDVQPVVNPDVQPSASPTAATATTIVKIPLISSQSSTSAPIIASTQDFIEYLKKLHPTALKTDGTLAPSICRIYRRSHGISRNFELLEKWNVEGSETLSQEVVLIHDLKKICMEAEENGMDGEERVQETEPKTDEALKLMVAGPEGQATDQEQRESDMPHGSPQPITPKPSNSFFKMFRNMLSSSSTISAKTGPTTGEAFASPIADGHVFGRALETLERNAECDDLPPFIYDALKLLGRPESRQEGLFRLSGTHYDMQELQIRLNSGERLADIMIAPHQIHNISGLFKQFLRQMPEPLLKFECYSGWQAVSRWSQYPVICRQMGRFLLQTLPDLNRRIFLALLGLLHQLMEESADITRMTAENYGTVIGPNLIWHQQEDRKSRVSETMGLSLQSSTLGSQLCTCFLRNFKELRQTHSAKGSINESNKESGSDENRNPLFTVFAIAQVLYDFDGPTEKDSDSSDSHDDPNSERANPVVEDRESVGAGGTDMEQQRAKAADPLIREGQLFFITGIEDAVDGWWLGFPDTPLTTSAGMQHPIRFPSNYLKVFSQLPDSCFL